MSSKEHRVLSLYVLSHIVCDSDKLIVALWSEEALLPSEIAEARKQDGRQFRLRSQ
jgi:hypothetical protein